MTKPRLSEGRLAGVGLPHVPGGRFLCFQATAVKVERQPGRAPSYFLCRTCRLFTSLLWLGPRFPHIFREATLHRTQLGTWGTAGEQTANVPVDT